MKELGVSPPIKRNEPFDPPPPSKRPTDSVRPLVTIAIPTFNRAAQYLPGALLAACAQTYPELDVLVADNASTDGTQDLVRGIKDNRVRYVRHRENIGAAANTNFCIAASRGEYTLLLNDDDLIDPNFVKSCIDALHDPSRPGLIRTGTRIIDDSGITIWSRPNRVAGLGFTDFVIAWAQGLTTPYLCSTLFKTSALQQIGMHSRHYLWDDVIAELKIAASHGRADIPDVLAASREHSNELTRSASVQAWIEDSVELLDTACQLAPHDVIRLRTHLVPFLANINYRRAAQSNASVISRLYGGWQVFRQFRMPPKSPDWFKQVLARESWYGTLVRGKQRFRTFARRNSRNAGDR